jgi:dihydrofolate reductase
MGTTVKMGRILVSENLTLDGVMQAPGSVDEDTSGGFRRGGWAVPYFDAMMAEPAKAGMSQGGGAFLFGRRTYEHFATVWPDRPDDDPFANVLNQGQKYVASRTLEEPLPWRNSTLLRGDAEDTVPQLKERVEQDLVILGSGQLVQALMRRGLIDEVRLLIHPLTLGFGRRLFPEAGAEATFRLVDTKSTGTGVVIATYEPSGPPARQPA